MIEGHHCFGGRRREGIGDLLAGGNCSVTVSTGTQTTQVGDCVSPPGLQNSATVVDNEGDSASVNVSA